MIVSKKKDDVKYTWIKLPEGLEAVEEGEDFTFNDLRGIEPNALVLGGRLLVRTKKKKKKKTK